MFDDSAKMMLFFAAVAASVIGLASDQMAPRDPLSTSVDIAALPPLPESAAEDGAPAQSRIAPMDVALGEGFEAELLYGYVLEGLVVSRREFRTDPTSAISPLDLGIVFGDMAAPDRVDDFEFSALPRALLARPAPGVTWDDSVEAQITNNHLVPANQAVSDALLAINVGDRVQLRGYLVEVTGAGIAPWRSSTRRDDATIIGGCEIILVTGIEYLPEEKDAA